jgi:hypothetical protein
LGIGKIYTVFELGTGNLLLKLLTFSYGEWGKYKLFWNLELDWEKETNNLVGTDLGKQARPRLNPTATNATPYNTIQVNCMNFLNSRIEVLIWIPEYPLLHSLILWYL